MLGLVLTALGGRKEDAEIFLDAGLAYVLIPKGRPEGLVEGFGGFFTRCFGIGHIRWLAAAFGAGAEALDFVFQYAILRAEALYRRFFL